MPGMPVLSDILKDGNKLGITPNPKGNDISDSPENVAVFATLFDSCLNSDIHLKGQKSSFAIPDSEEKQSTANSGQIDQNPYGVESMPGPGNHLLSFFTQLILQSGLPIAKEVNAGDSINQRIENFSLAKEIFVPNGSGSQKSPSDNLGITKLDKYRQIISDLLVALSGKITDPTPKGTHLGAGNPGTGEHSLELTKIVQGWMAATDDVQKNNYNIGGQKALQSLFEGLAKGSSNVEPDMPMANLSAVLSPRLQTVNEALITLINQLKSMKIGSETMVGGWKETALLTNNQQQSEGPGLQGSKIIQDFLDKIQAAIKEDFTNRGALTNKEALTDKEALTKADHLKSDKFVGNIKENTNKENTNKEVQNSEPVKSMEFGGIKDGQSQPSSIGAGVTVNVIQPHLAEGKIVWLPLWEQIAGVVREHVLSRQQNLKELNIQLHPEDLGKIRIFLRWENGQVHLQVNATEAATGQLLQNQLPELRQNLLNQGVNCGSLQMGQNGEHQQQSQGDQANSGFHQNYSLPNEDEAVIPVLNPLFYGQDGINRINVTA